MSRYAKHVLSLSAAGAIVALSTLLAQESSAPGGTALPFTIPPSGSPEVLEGVLGFEPPTALAFDSRNRPYMINTRDPKRYGYILTLREGRWVRLWYKSAVAAEVEDLLTPTTPDAHALGALAIDDADAIYAVIHTPAATRGKDGQVRRRGGPPVLLYSDDLGDTFRVYRVPAHTLEVATGHNTISRPPAIALLELLKKAEGIRWGDFNRFTVALPEKKGHELTIPEPVHVTDRCLGMSTHSGGQSFAVTVDDKTHVVYAEIPEEANGGNPTYVATIDRNTRRVVARKFLLTAPPEKPDVHSTPVITADSKGYLHVLTGAHGEQFYYLRSKEPSNIEGGWTHAVPVDNRQTYATLVCDGDDRLHTVYRRWTPLPTLAYQSITTNDIIWQKPTTLVAPPDKHKGYGIFYHRLFIDRRGGLYVRFNFFEFDTGTKGRYPQFLALSEDGGKTWGPASEIIFRRRQIE